MSELDAILGELCELESQLTNQQSELETSAHKQHPLEHSGNAIQADADLISAGLISPEDTQRKNGLSYHKTDSSIDGLESLQNALSELSELTGVCLDENESRKSVKPKVPAKPPKRSNSARILPQNGILRPSILRISANSDSESDSAFSDAVSLPSSGSRVSLTTTGSQNSGSSSNSATSGVLVSPTNSITIRIYTEEDGSNTALSVEEHLNVGEVIQLFAEKKQLRPDITWALVERLPELYMERILEDHDSMVENVLHWTKDSQNRLIFARKSEKYHLFLRPEMYLLTTPAQANGDSMAHALIQEFFLEQEKRVPEIEGPLYLKTEGKKTWKKYHFMLRVSGLYYCPKGKMKTPKDLVCLQSLEFIDVYYGLGWKKKYKSPNEFTFALKHPQIQKKDTKYVKYLCAESKQSMLLWTTGIRIAKHGKQLYENFQAVQNAITNEPQFSNCNQLPRNNSIDRRYKHSQSDGLQSRNVPKPPPKPLDKTGMTNKVILRSSSLNRADYSNDNHHRNSDISLPPPPMELLENGSSFISENGGQNSAKYRDLSPEKALQHTTAVIRRTPSSSPRHLPKTNSTIHRRSSSASGLVGQFGLAPPPVSSQSIENRDESMIDSLGFYEDLDRVNTTKHEHSIHLQESMVNSPPTSPYLGFHRNSNSFRGSKTFGKNGGHFAPPPVDFFATSAKKVPPPPPPKRSFRTKLSFKS